jgi:hypothetical protein
MWWWYNKMARIEKEWVVKKESEVGECKVWGRRGRQCPTYPITKEDKDGNDSRQNKTACPSSEKEGEIEKDENE